jgi:hypothetical protein
MTILGVVKMSVCHARQGLQRFSKMGLASVKCRVKRQSNAVLGVGPMPWGVSRMPLSRRPNAVPLSVECRVSVGRMPCPRNSDRPKRASAVCRAFLFWLFADEVALLARGWVLFDLDRILGNRKSFDRSDDDQGLQGFTQSQLEVPKVGCAAAAQTMKRVDLQRIRRGVGR